MSLLPNERPAPEERRSEPRVAVDDPVSILVLNPLDPNRLAGRVLDISRNGLRVRTQKFLSRGTVLQLRVRDLVVMGEVRYCVKRADSFDAGIHIQDCVATEDQRQAI